MEKKSSVTPPGIDPGTFRLVAQCSLDYCLKLIQSLNFKVCHPRCVCTNEREENVVKQHN